MLPNVTDREPRSSTTVWFQCWWSHKNNIYIYSGFLEVVLGYSQKTWNSWTVWLRVYVCLLVCVCVWAIPTSLMHVPFSNAFTDWPIFYLFHISLICFCTNSDCCYNTDIEISSGCVSWDVFFFFFCNLRGKALSGQLSGHLSTFTRNRKRLDT